MYCPKCDRVRAESHPLIALIKPADARLRFLLPSPHYKWLVSAPAHHFQRPNDTFFQHHPKTLYLNIAVLDNKRPMKLDAPTPRPKQSGQSFTICVIIAVANKFPLSEKSPKPSSTPFTPRNPSLSAPQKDKHRNKSEVSHRPFDDTRKIDCRTRGDLLDGTALPRRERLGQ